MTKRAKIIIGVLIALLLGAGVAAGLLTSSGVSTSKSSNQIKEEIETALNEKDYFEEVQVRTYSGAAEEKNPDTSADSAAITISVNKLDDVSFKEITSLLPDMEMSSFYTIADSKDIENITTVTGFTLAELKDESVVSAISTSLKEQAARVAPFWQISRGNAEGDDDSKMKTQFVAPENDVALIMEIVENIRSKKMDVLPVAKTELSDGSFVQFAAVEGKMDNYQAGLELGLKFADQVFLDGEQIVFLGLGDDIQISYTSLREGLTHEQVTQIAKDLNKEQLFKVTVVSPEEGPTTGTPPADSPETTETPTEESTPSPEETK